MKTKEIALKILFDFFNFNSLSIKIKPRNAKFKNDGIRRQKVRRGLKNIFFNEFFLWIMDVIHDAKIITENIEVNIEILPKDTLNKTETFNRNEPACKMNSMINNNINFMVLVFTRSENSKILDWDSIKAANINKIE